MQATNGCGLCSVKIEHLGVAKGRAVLLDDVNFEMHCGELTALIGVNGAGKTTLLRSVLGEIHHSGSVTYASHDGLVLLNITIGYVPQHLEFDRSAPVSVLDFLQAGRHSAPVWLGRGIKEKRELLESLAACGCERLAGRRLGELSGGELQRVMLAQAVDPIPELLILDEPVSGVDTVGSELFYERTAELRRKHHMAIAMVSHDLALVRRYADKVLLINKRVLISGTPDQVFASKEFRAAFQGRD